MDRCALFVDAGYVLADGAMAVHGTRHRGPVSWDYAGLLQFLNGLARDRTGLPVLRCYWYEATVEGRRTAEHDALADLPGLKLRLGRIRPGRRAGVESEIRRDLATLARNGAITDALVVSADEDLAQVVADVQDLGVRVTIVHLAVDGNWTISRPLRQECDDIIEVGDTHLRPYAGLIAGAESAHSEPQPAGADAGRPPANGYGTAGSTSHQQALPAVSSAAPPASYTAPVVAEHQPAAQPLMNGAVAALAPAGTADVTGAGAVLRRTGSTQETQVQPQGGHSQGESQPSQQGEQPQGRTDHRSQPAEPAQGQPAPAHGQPAFAQGQPAPAQGQPVQGPDQPGPVRGHGHPGGHPGQPAPGPGYPGEPGSHLRHPYPAPPGRFPGQPERRSSRPYAGSSGRQEAGSLGPPSQPYGAQQRPYGGPHAAAHPPGPQPTAMPVADAAASAHAEGFEFGQSVGREAPALWLEAVLARKPRMPSDLEARLLQDSALPIDSLLHDEVRHALRRGFWDALERARR